MSKIASPAAAAAASGAADAAPALPVLDTARGRVLVVDDETRNRALLREALESAGHRVDEAANGRQALDWVATTQPDVVLLDVVMPEMDGFEACRALKSDPATASIPVLMVTGLTERDDRLRGIAAGADDFLNKPFDRDELGLRVRNAVFRKQLFDALQRQYRELKAVTELRDSLIKMIMADTEALALLVAHWKAHGQDGAAAQTPARQEALHGQD